MLEDFGPLGRAYCETDPEQADLETTVTDLMCGQYGPVRVVAFNTASDGPKMYWRTLRRRSCAVLILQAPNCRRH